ncbi:unnamed protein product [Symbiodinium sp. CCMP2592]|nr:unnamed protein product [Symbiodinium sp. CCMP2592]
MQAEVARREICKLEAVNLAEASASQQRYEGQLHKLQQRVSELQAELAQPASAHQANGCAPEPEEVAEEQPTENAAPSGQGIAAGAFDNIQDVSELQAHIHVLEQQCSTLQRKLNARPIVYQAPPKERPSRQRSSGGIVGVLRDIVVLAKMGRLWHFAATESQRDKRNSSCAASQNGNRMSFQADQVLLVVEVDSGYCCELLCPNRWSVFQLLGLFQGMYIQWTGTKCALQLTSACTDMIDKGTLDVNLRAKAARTWGNELAGGGSSDLPTGISRLFATNDAFAAVRSDGTVATWGDPTSGGNSDAVQHLLHDVQEIFATKAAFAALRSDGSVITWGSPMYGGNSSRVEHQLQGGVARVYAAECAFAAVRTDGSLVTWGYPRYGGCCEAVRHQLVAEALKAACECQTPR